MMKNANANHGHDIAHILSKPTFIIVTPDDILQAGLVYAGFDLARQSENNEVRQIRWFKAFYGAAPVTIAAMFAAFIFFTGARTQVGEKYHGGTTVP
jgi:hypothetical protein